MSSQLNISNIKPLTGSGTINIGSTSSNTIQVNTTTQTITSVGTLEGNTIKGIGANTVNYTTPMTVGGETLGGRRNIIINGAMKVSQRSTSATGLGNSSGYNALDRFGYFSSGAGRFTKAQVAVTDLVGFTNAMKISCTTADTSVDASDYMHFNYSIEGQDLQHLAYNTANAKPLRVSFYVKGNAAATYTFRIQTQPNGGVARWFGKEFSVTTSWNRVTIEIPGDTDTGADHGIDNNVNVGMFLVWYLQGGSNYSSGTFAESTWQDRDYTKAVGDNQSNFFDSTSRTLEITGIQMEVGTVVTPFEHMSFAEDLILCQRYYQKLATITTFGPIGLGRAWSTSRMNVSYPLKVTMRDNPALSASDVTNHMQVAGISQSLNNVHNDGASGVTLATDQECTGVKIGFEHSSTPFTTGTIYQAEFDDATDGFIEINSEL